MKWHRVARTTEVDPSIPLHVRVGDNSLAVCKLGDEYHVLDDLCTHEFALLSDGTIEGDCVECPLHGAQFEIRTGKAMTAPATEDVKTYPAKVEGGEIWVGIAD